jgi:hypothetical protein
METTGWLSRDELIFHRMVTFHRERVEAIQRGSSPLVKHQGGTLVVHLIPHRCAGSRHQFEWARLKEHGKPIRPLGERGGYSRFNVDGYLHYNREREITAYSQVFRDGRLEATMTDIGYQQNGAWVVRDTICESGVFALVSAYLIFCKGIELEPPLTLFSALVGCNGFRFAINPRWVDLSEYAVDRSPAYLPEIEIPSLDVEPQPFLRLWCDTFWQAGGVEKSYSYDEEGKWHERR